MPARALLLCAALGATAAAQDLGEPVSFGPARETLQAFSAVPGAGAAPLWTAEGHPVPVPWDTLLFHGVSPDPGVRFEASRSAAGGGWTPWAPVEMKRFPEGRFWARAELRPASPGAVRLRALDGGVSRGHEVEVYGFEVFAARTLDARREGPEKGDAAPPARPGRPPVHGRDEWGARPPKEPYAPTALRRITIHHTSGPQTRTLEESLREVRFIQDFHQEGRRWNDIAYHYLIDAGGRIFEGRPEWAQGAHTKHNNEGNLGVVLLGHYHPPKDHRLTPEQWEALAALGLYAVSSHGIAPSTLRGHRDYKATDCPGDLVYPRLPELQAAITPPPPPAAAASRTVLRAAAGLIERARLRAASLP